MQVRRLWWIGLVVVALSTLTTLHTAAAPLTTFVVDSTGNGADSDLSDHACGDSSGHCTLTAALDQAEFDEIAVTIQFDIGGGGVQTIVNGGGSDSFPVVIDGTTQPNFTGKPLIVLSGGGLALDGGNSTVRGLVLNNSISFALSMSGNGNLITGNYIGTDAGGLTAVPNLGGIDLGPGMNNTVRGNLISGNSDTGIFIQGGMSGTVVEGNLIGTDVTGNRALGNDIGVKITNANNNIVGGTTPDARNVISGNTGDGVETTVNATGNVIEGNYIGVDRTGKGALGNGGRGVILTSSGNTIGGTTPGAGNLIAHNTFGGVVVTDSIFGHSINNAIRGNTIFNNTGLGIDLGGSGVTPNDPGDADVGPNNLQNYPVLKSATAATKVLKGKLNSTPNTTFTLEFFSNKSCDSSKYGEGKTFLGEKSVTTNGSGNTSFTFTASRKFKVGSALTATATDPLGSTSEFSKCRAAI